MRGKPIIIVALALVITFAFASSGLQAADSIKAYMGFAREINEALAKQIKDNTGVTVENITLSWGEIAARLKMEKPRFNADMVICFGTAEALHGTKKGWYIPYMSPAWADVDPVFKSAEGYYWALGTWSFVLVGNKDKLAEKGYSLPTSWNELLDPKWKGQIVAPSPRTSGTAYMMTYSFLQLYGEDKGWDFLSGLDNNMAFYTKSGNAPTDLVSRGEYLLGITSDENVLKRINDGYPLVWGVPEEGLGFEAQYVTILKGTKKLELCKKVVDYLGSQQLSEFLGSQGFFPPRPGIGSALYGKEKPKYINIDQGWAVKNKRRLIKDWKLRFMMKETPKAKKVGDEKERKAAEAEKNQYLT